MRSFKSLNIIVLALSFTEIPVFATNAISVEDAAKKGLIKLLIKSKGGHTGEVIEMKIKNLSNRRLDLRLEAGRKLDSKKETEQDILVTKPQEFFVNSGQERSLNVYGMCCQAGNSSPRANSVYGIGKLGDSSLIKLATFIDKNNYYTSHSAQQAVWTISDNNSLGSITDGDKKMQDNLRNYVSKITGKVIPPYDITYQSGNDGSVMGRATKIEGVFSYTVPTDGNVTVGIYDEEGKLVQLLFKDITHEKGECKLYYIFRTRDLVEGTYYARMKMDGMLQKEEKIVF